MSAVIAGALQQSLSRCQDVKGRRREERDQRYRNTLYKVSNTGYTPLTGGNHQQPCITATQRQGIILAKPFHSKGCAAWKMKIETGLNLPSYLQGDEFPRYIIESLQDMHGQRSVDLLIGGYLSFRPSSKCASTAEFSAMRTTSNTACGRGLFDTGDIDKVHLEKLYLLSAYATKPLYMERQHPPSSSPYDQGGKRW